MYLRTQTPPPPPPPEKRGHAFKRQFGRKD